MRLAGLLVSHTAENNRPQVHPVVARVCAAIEGTDSAQLADCLGLDPAKFRGPAQASSAFNGEDAMLAAAPLLDDDARFKVEAGPGPHGCRSLEQFQCNEKSSAAFRVTQGRSHAHLPLGAVSQDIEMQVTSRSALSEEKNLDLYGRSSPWLFLAEHACQLSSMSKCSFQAYMALCTGYTHNQHKVLL